VVLTALGGALVPLSVLPGWAAAAAPASPGYWAMTALHGALIGQAGATLRAAGVLAAIGLAAAAVAAWRIGRGWGRSKLL
jgi:ABC-2 type transport system permease protein